MNTFDLLKQTKADRVWSYETAVWPMSVINRGRCWSVTEHDTDPLPLPKIPKQTLSSFLPGLTACQSAFKSFGCHMNLMHRLSQLPPTEIGIFQHPATSYPHPSEKKDAAAEYGCIWKRQDQTQEP